MDLHNGEKPYQCEYCENAFSNESNLSDHMEMHRDNNFENYRLCTEEKSHQYTSSNKCSSNKSDSIIHVCNNYISTISNDIDNAVSSVDGFVSHTGNHIGEKSYQCRYCNKIFLHNGALLIHEKTHLINKTSQSISCNKKNQAKVIY